MSTKSYMSDNAVLSEFGRALAERRIAMGLTQAALAEQAGIGKRTVERIEAGNSCQTSALIRVLRVLGLQDGLNQLVPRSGPSPMNLLKMKGKEHKRVSSKRQPQSRVRRKTGRQVGKTWTWGDEA